MLNDGGCWAWGTCETICNSKWMHTPRFKWPCHRMVIHVMLIHLHAIFHPKSSNVNLSQWMLRPTHNCHSIKASIQSESFSLTATSGRQSPTWQQSALGARLPVFWHRQQLWSDQDKFCHPGRPSCYWLLLTYLSWLTIHMNHTSHVYLLYTTLQSPMNTPRISLNRVCSSGKLSITTPSNWLANIVPLS